MEDNGFIKLKDENHDDNNNEKTVKGRARSKSLFEAERPKLSETDRGVFVLSHADFPRGRTQSNPTDTDCLNNDKHQGKPWTLYEGKIRKIIHDVFESALSGKAYNSKECKSVVKELASRIKDKVAELQLPNYKLACTCLVTQRNSPSPVIESGCIWDSHKSSDDRDAFVELLFKNEEIYALGTVYGVFDEKFEKTWPTSSKSGGRPSPIPE